jgi:hypothetical protein
LTQKEGHRPLFLLNLLITTAPSSLAPKSTGVYEPGVVEMTAIEVGPVVSFKERTVMCEVETIPVVTIPGRVVIVGVSGKLRFTDRRSGIITVRINRSGCGRISSTVNNGRGSYNDTRSRNPESNVCANENLGITFCSDEAGGHDGSENK